MVVCRIIGWVFVLLALGAVAYEIIEAVDAGKWRMIALGEIWFKLDASSLNGAQAVIQRYVAPWLWEPVITTILRWSAWFTFGAPGLVLLVLFRKRSRHQRHMRRRWR